MHCSCGQDTYVIDTRKTPEGAKWRKRLCKACKTEFTTVEVRCKTEKVPRTFSKPKAVRSIVKRVKKAPVLTQLAETPTAVVRAPRLARLRIEELKEAAEAARDLYLT